MNRRREWFPTQERLLASSRRDGDRATAYDTKNSFEWIGGFGWSQLVPVGGTEGQPLVVDDTGIVVPDTKNRLIPSGGTPGQVPTIDQFGDTSLVNPSVAGGVTYPVDFSGGTTVACLDRVIPAGALGPNGFLRLTALIVMTTDASRTIEVGVTAGPTTNSLVTASLGSNANHWGVEWSFLMLNQADEAVQIISQRLSWSLWIDATTGSSSEAFQQQTGQEGALDTTADWELTAAVLASGVVTGEALVSGVAVEYGYAA